MELQKQLVKADGSLAEQALELRPYAAHGPLGLLANLLGFFTGLLGESLHIDLGHGLPGTAIDFFQDLFNDGGERGALTSLFLADVLHFDIGEGQCDCLAFEHDGAHVERGILHEEPVNGNLLPAPRGLWASRAVLTPAAGELLHIFCRTAILLPPGPSS